MNVDTTDWSAAPPARRSGAKGRRLPVPHVTRTRRDLEDGIAAYGALRVNLIAEILRTVETLDDNGAAAVGDYRRAVDEARLVEARAQLARINGTLGMLIARRPR